MKLMIVMVAVVVLTLALDMFTRRKLKKKQDEALNKLGSYLNEKDFKSFDQYIESDEIKKIFPEYNIKFLKLNEAILKEDKSIIDKAFLSFDNVKMNKAQKSALYHKGFYYYLALEDKKKTDKYYSLLKEGVAEDIERIDCAYDTYLLKGSKYLDKVLDIVKNLKEEEALPYYSLLIQMYENKGEKDKVKEYADILDKYINEQVAQ